MQMGRIDGYNQRSTTKKETVFTWTNVYEDEQSLPATSGVFLIHSSSISISLPVLLVWHTLNFASLTLLGSIGLSLMLDFCTPKGSSTYRGFLFINYYTCAYQFTV